MFSANENLLLRQSKRKVVEYVESTMSDDVMDMGVNVMVMQVSCKQPGCVPLETAIIIVFPNNTNSDDEELIPGLPESKGGGSYKTKVLKPLNEVTKQDVLEALPPAFEGGLRTMEKLFLQARDVMFVQIAQIFGTGGGGYDDDDDDESAGDVEGRRLMAEYLVQSLHDYIDRDCIPPKWGEPFPEMNKNGKEDDKATTTPETSSPTPPTTTAASATTTTTTSYQGTGNLVIRRPVDRDEEEGNRTTTSGRPSTTTSSQSISKDSTAASLSSTTINGSSSRSASWTASPPPGVSINSMARRRQQQAAEQQLSSNNNDGTTTDSSNSILSRLSNREHAPGIRRPGCPCCDPDNPTNVVDRMLLL